MALKVWFDRADLGRSLHIALVREREDGKLWIGRVQSDGEIEYLEQQQNTPIRPTFIFYNEGQQFLKACAEELSRQGIKTDNDHKIEGKLEATKYHLEDLRFMLKLKK